MEPKPATKATLAAHARLASQLPRDTGEDFADEARPGGPGNRQAGPRVPHDIDPERQVDLGPELADRGGHRRGHLGPNAELVGQVGLVAEEQPIDTDFMEDRQVVGEAVDDPAHPGRRVVAGAARQGRQMTHGDDRLVRAEPIGKQGGAGAIQHAHVLVVQRRVRGMFEVNNFVVAT